MKIRNVMTADVETCHPDTDLATVVRMMWDRDTPGTSAVA